MLMIAYSRLSDLCLRKRSWVWRYKSWCFTSLQFCFCHLSYGHRKWPLPSECDVTSCVMKHDDPQQALKSTRGLEAISSKKCRFYFNTRGNNEEQKKRNCVSGSLQQNIKIWSHPAASKWLFKHQHMVFTPPAFFSISKAHYRTWKRHFRMYTDTVQTASQCLSLSHQLQCYSCSAALTHSFS